MILFFLMNLYFFELSVVKEISFLFKFSMYFTVLSVLIFLFNILSVIFLMLIILKDALFFMVMMIFKIFLRVEKWKLYKKFNYR